MFKQIVSLLAPAAIVLFLLYEIAGTQHYTDAELRQVSERAVAMAERGAYDAAEEQFQAVFTVAPDFLHARADHLVVLHWQERHAEMLQRAERLPWAELPAYALRALALAAIHEQRVQLAGRYARQALRNAPRDEGADLALELGLALLQSGEADQAATLLDQALARYPGDAQLLTHRRIAGLYRGDPAADALPPLNGDPQLRRDYAEALVAALAQRDSPRLRAKLDALVAEAPDDPFLRARQAMVLSWSGEHSLALQRFEGLDLEAESEPVRRAHAYSALAEGQPQLALAWLRQRYREEPGVDRGLLLARALTDSGRHTEALTVLHPLASRHPDDPSVALALAYALERDGDAAAAAAAFARALRLGVDDTAVYDSWLENLVQLPPDQPLEGSDIAADPATPEVVRRGFFRLLLARGDDAVAGQLLAGASIADAPVLLQVLGRAAWQARREGQYRRALALYELGLQQAPTSRELALGRALTLSEAGQVGAADAAFGQLLATAPRDVQVLDAALAHARRHGDVAAQRALLRRLVARDSRYVDAWLALEDEREPQALLDELVPLRQRHPGEPRLAVALARVAQQMGDCDLATRHLADPALGAPDAGQAEAAGFIARSCDAPALAADWYRRGLAARPQASDDAARLRAGLMLALGQGGDIAAADALYQRLDHDTADAGVLRALADHAGRRDDWPAAVVHLERLLVRYPDDDAAWRERALALGHAGESARALDLAEQRPGLFTPEELAGLRAGHAAVLLAREGHGPATEALSLLDVAARELPAGTLLRERVENDRLIALGQAGRDRQMLDTAAQRPAGTLPDYVLLALADAHLRQGEAEQALAQVERVAARHPGDEALQRRLFYALLDADQPRRAEALVQQMAATAGAGWDPAGTEPLPWALRQAALVDAWHNRLERARRQLEHYRRQRPDDAETALALATVYRWQGRPEAALPHYELAAQLQPVAAGVGEAYARWDRREYPVVSRRLDSLIEQAPRDAGVQQLQQDWALAQRPNLVARAMTGGSTGTTFGSRDAEAEVWLYSAPLARRYRVYGHDRYAWAKFPEGNGRLHRAGVGVDYRGEQIGWRVQVDRSLLDGGGDSGLSLAADWRPGDHWTLATDLQSYSRDVPLRAIRAGIDGRSAAFSVRHQWHSGRWLQGSVSGVDFSDGNDRYAFGLTHYHHVWGAPRQQLALRQSLYTSGNSRGDDVPYFNPDRDLALGLGAEYVGQLPATRIRRWQHRLSVGAGHYWQRGYGGALIWDAEYEHRWQMTPALSIHLGGLYRQRTYDGDDEGYWAAHAGLDWRF